jgi:hypothetical protein
MSDQTVRIPYEGGIADAEAIEVVSENGFSGEFVLSDGTKLEYRLQMQQVFKVKDKKKENGEPIYMTTLQIVNRVIWDRSAPQGETGVEDASS